jgi:putative hemolysin
MSESQLLVSTARTGAPDSVQYSLLVARDTDEVRAAQRLRYQVFAEEMGATVHAEQPGVETDDFDDFCDHLIVRDDRSGAVVGTYRMLPPDRARAAGRLYAESEFDLASLRPLRSALVETGRSCVHPEHRSGAVVSLVWAGIARYMLLSGHRWLAGCASVQLADGGPLAAKVWDLVTAKHFAPEEYRVSPHLPWDPDPIARVAGGPLPPLLKGYLRLGAWVCGRPAHDPDFGVADFFTLLDLHQMDQRYLRFFLGAAA